VFALEECVQEESTPKMAHLRVVPVLVNGVTEEEALLDSGSQIVSITRDMAAANKISWDPSLSIQLQSANKSLSQICGLAKNVLFMLGDIPVPTPEQGQKYQLISKDCYRESQRPWRIFTEPRGI